MQVSSTSTQTTPALERVQPRSTLHRQLERKLAALHKYRGTVQFFHNHRSLLSSDEHSAAPARRLSYAQRRIHALTATIHALRHDLHERTVRRLARLRPRAAICSVFGAYCHEAVAVAWCESRLSPDAVNGQYLGLFQMGWYERRLFGHGSTPRAQAIAAHRYFVRSGRDWSPWSCGRAAA